MDNHANEHSGKWKQISKTVKQDRTIQNTQTEFNSSISTGSASYILFRDEPYCIVDDAVFMMLPVDEPSLGYKLVGAALDKKTVCAKAINITENQALNNLHKMS